MLAKVESEEMCLQTTMKIGSD
uniref:Uncharacterized protein n=1 Tax=Anguilla anguilla TaxID=7936 RepID=A0A0E9XMH1_ANGAN